MVVCGAGGGVFVDGGGGWWKWNGVISYHAVRAVGSWTDERFWHATTSIWREKI